MFLFFLTQARTGRLTRNPWTFCNYISGFTGFTGFTVSLFQSQFKQAEGVFVLNLCHTIHRGNGSDFSWLQLKSQGVGSQFGITAASPTSLKIILDVDHNFLKSPDNVHTSPPTLWLYHQIVIENYSWCVHWKWCSSSLSKPLLQGKCLYHD